MIPNQQSIINTFANGVIGVNTAEKICAFNKGAENIFGLVNENVLGQPVLHVFPALGKVLLESLRHKDTFENQEIIEGNLKLLVNLNQVFDKNLQTGVICLIQDLERVNDLWLKIDNLRKIRDQFEAIFDSSYDGLFISDGSGKIIRCNQSSERLIGHSQENIIGKNVSELIYQGYIDKSVTLEVLQKKTSLTILQKLRNGKTILVTGTPVFNDKEEIEFVVTNERDITVLNRMKHQLREYKILADNLEEKGVLGPANFLIHKNVVAHDKKSQEIFQTAKVAAKFDTAILIQGESGVGKGLVARYIHDCSQRKDAPLVQINCGAIPRQLIESELFGYRKGAFTGAAATGKQGLFEMADKGTLFLDEIGEIPLDLQVKFLKALEDKEILPVGDTKPRKIDVRIIAATNRDLDAMISRGLFREDLFFRLNVIPVHVPPLRDRRDDIFPMITRHLGSLNARFGTAKSISPEAMDVLTAYSYPGNIRELENIIERIMILCPEDEIRVDHLPAALTRTQPMSDWLEPETEGLTLKSAMERYEREIISNAVAKYGSKAKAARALGVDPSTVVRKILKYHSRTGSAILHE